MNDRFKFRCFSKKTKKMYEVDSLHLDSENEWVWVHYYNPIYDKDLKIQIEQPNAIIMQCTGMKDKNGKLIYEGDILKDKYGALHSISWNVKGFYEADTFAVAGFYNAIQEDMEVIGNIQENKELLEEKCRN